MLTEKNIIVNVILFLIVFSLLLLVSACHYKRDVVTVDNEEIMFLQKMHVLKAPPTETPLGTIEKNTTKRFTIIKESDNQ